MATPHGWLSYSVSPVALVVIMISNLTLGLPPRPLRLSHIGSDLLPLHWKNGNHRRSLPGLRLPKSTNPFPLLFGLPAPLKASSIF